MEYLDWISLFKENGKHGKLNYDYLNALNVPLSKDMPSFVYWNWPVIRKATFFIFLSGIFAMCAIVGGMIYNLPKTCNPTAEWYQGSVFYEIFPASFKDSNGNQLKLVWKSVAWPFNQLAWEFEVTHAFEHYKDSTSIHTECA